MAFNLEAAFHFQATYYVTCQLNLHIFARDHQAPAIWWTNYRTQTQTFALCSFSSGSEVSDGINPTLTHLVLRENFG